METIPCTAGAVIESRGPCRARSYYDRREFPSIGYRYEPVREREVRILLFGHYRIAYLVRPDGDIDILGVFHGALEIDRYLL